MRGWVDGRVGAPTRPTTQPRIAHPTLELYHFFAGSEVSQRILKNKATRGFFCEKDDKACIVHW